MRTYPRGAIGFRLVHELDGLLQGIRAAGIINDQERSAPATLRSRLQDGSSPSPVTRRAVSERRSGGCVSALGGTPSETVTKHTNYLVVCDCGSPHWAFSCYGLKVEKAHLMRL
jgi:hypothetical protein